MAGFQSDAFFDQLDSSTRGIESADTLPPLCYTDPEFYEFEKEALFNHEWLCLGRADQIPEAGDYFTTTIIGEPLIVARNRAGDIKVMSAVCQHRAMLVAEGQGNTRAFLCPYHHWAYSLDGDLIGAPEMERTENFDKKDFCLPTLKVELWQGFIFANFDPEAEPLAPRLTACDDVLANYDLENAKGPELPEGVRYPWNWKVMMENNNDGYHANRLHHGPLHDFVPSGLAEFPEDLPENTAGYYRTNGTLHPDASFNPTQKAVLPVFPKLTDAERNRFLFVNVPPTLSLVLTSDLVMFLILRADGPEHHINDTGILCAPGAMDDPSFQLRLDMIYNATANIVAQDLHVDEQVQKGLRSRYAVRGRYSWQERAQTDFNDWVVKRYQTTWERMKAQGRDQQIPLRAV
ncbi:aromatic ring-hydroxylating oxygenase subunit alpha [Marinobacter sp. JSM 1782161]|uniref:aromatic ring-hydroxylating oxygenase subunit alpha n=1 Tax=Marinobacter sp. JSM 1782161 TaxID=2685906 RepID=UPI001402249B|nr:aromatic ring-hydroxylating dioxygenase subunit alpha [Marinobacter sp. JSM 1782161]